MALLPEGTITFMLTDLQGSTQAWERQPKAMRSAMARHDAILASTVRDHSGQLVEAGREGDSVLAVYRTAATAAACALEIQKNFATESWPEGLELKVRVALHTGEAQLREGHYFGPALNRCARLLATCHPGQILLTKATEAMLADELPPGAELQDLGLHRLKDLARPEQVFQLEELASSIAFPPIRSLAHQLPAASGMPPRLSSFVGRRKELAELRRLLPHTRLLTFLGSGGSGKTRLATEFVRHQEARTAESAVFVDLGEISDGRLVIEAIARAAGIKLQGADPLGSLLRQVQHRRLLVVDNCEHLIGPAADVVAQLLTACPQLSVIATSRERLKLEGETIYRVPSLSVPAEGLDVTAADNSDAVRLFVDRARSVRPGFLIDASNAGTVLTICRRLDGIPLAIELAAARMTTLSPHDILPRLEDSLRLLTGGSRNAISRQHTLRATVDWSYQLLDLTEQRLLQRISVFAGSTDADAVQEVCAFAPLEPSDVLDVLTRLVEKSMVQIEGGDERMRYRLLETIRKYGGEKLTLEGHDDGVHDRHMARYRRLVAAASEARRHRGAMTEHRLIWREMNDVRAALEWARRDPDVELEMLGNLFLIWMVNSPTEGFERLTDALRNAEPRPAQTFLRAALAWGALGGLTGRRLDRVEPPEELAQRLIALARDSNDPFIAATIEISIGYDFERRLGDLERAQPHMVAAVGLFQELGPSPTMAMAMGSLGSIEARMGRLDAGREWIEKAVAMALEVDDEFGAVGAYFHLGYFELDHGTRDKALAAFLAGLELVERDDTLSITDQVAGIACAMASDDPRYALRLFSAAARIRSLVAPSGGVLWAPRIEKGVQEARLALPKQEAGKAWASADRLTPDALRTELRERFSPAAVPRRKETHGLSRREMEVAELVAAGMTSRAIGEKLFLAERTVETHVNHIMTKLGFNSRAQVAAWVAEQRTAPTPGG